MQGMRIWKLIPINLRDPIWKKWSPEPIIVRAESESEARQWAQLKTAKHLPAVFPECRSSSTRKPGTKR
jgi:hypothetical protein